MVRLLVTLGACLALAPAAAAQVPSCVAPPGTAAVDEYCEAIHPPNGRPGAEQRLPRLRGEVISTLQSTPRGQRILRSIGAFKKGRTQRLVTSATPASGAGTLAAVGVSLGNATTLGIGVLGVALAITVAMLAWFFGERRRRNA